MDDRELLERAAKAIGREIHHWSTILPGPMLTDPATGECSHYWNPLDEDGDALRLAVQLGFNVMTCGREGAETLEIQVGGAVPRTTFQPVGADGRPAATRRAIVRAAAALA